MKTKIAAVLFGNIIIFGFLVNLQGLQKSFFDIDYETETNKFKEVYHNFKAYRDVADNYFSTKLNYKTKFIDLNGLVLRLCGMRVVDDEQYRVVKLSDGYLSFVIPKESDLVYPLQQTKSLSDYLSHKGIPLLYVQAPYKVCKENPQLPPGVEDYSNIMADKFLKELRDYGIDTLDLREKLHEGQMDHHSLFYKTDHHWTPEAGIWATGKIALEMEKNYGFLVNKKAIDIDNYSCTTYPNWMLGSLGRRVGIGYAGLEDFKLYLPNFSSPLTYKICDRDMIFQVDFSKQPFVPEHIERDYYNRSMYVAYTGGDFTHTELYNENDKTGQKLLVIRESFATVVSPFLGLSCSRLDTVDLRYQGSEAKSFIDQMNPDYVIILYNPNTLTSNKAFDFIVD